MLENHQPAATPLDLVLDADREITRLGTGDPYRLYEALHQIAARFAPVDAFYVCLYCEADQSLFFPYNYDNGAYDFPSTLSLGDGPTSQVVRRKTPFVWNTEEESRALPGVNFGDLSTFSHSAVSLPIPAPAAPPDAPLLGVLSAQCYTPHAYDPQAVRLLQWLADRAGLALAHERAVSLAAERQRHAALLSDRFVQMLSRIGRDAQAVSALLPPEAPAPLRRAAADFLRTCHRSQTEVNQFLLHPVPPPPSAPPVPADPLAALTPREREILALLAAGHTNPEIADHLFIAHNTVKDHLKRIFAKIGAASRHEATTLFRDHSQ